MKKILLLSFLILFLSSCGTDESTTTPSSLVPFENDNFSMNLPSNWDIVKDVDNTLPRPST
jgi:hypothetical protein